MAIDMASVEARVKASGMFRRVGDAQTLATALDDPGTIFPAAFVVLSREQGEASKLLGRHQQRIQARISVAFAVQAQRAGVGPNGEVEALRSTLKNYLAGWTPVGADAPLNYAFSNMVGLRDGMVWVETAFDTTYLFVPAL